jgi:uncharacterized protein (UPF0254 family)
MVCGLPLALSVMLIVALLLPELEGVNVMLIWQVPEAATGLLQVLVSPKSDAFVPAI